MLSDIHYCPPSVNMPLSHTHTLPCCAVSVCIVRRSFHQHERLYSILMPMFITVLPGEWEGREGCVGGMWRRAGGKEHLYSILML